MFLQKPKDVKRFIKVEPDINHELQKVGFMPEYKWDGFFYYFKTDTLLIVLENLKKG